jgi:hypothetical protein
MILIPAEILQPNLTTSNKLDLHYVQHSSGQAPRPPFRPDFSGQSEEYKAN